MNQLFEPPATRTMAVALVSYRRVAKGALIGIADIQVGALLIKGATVLVAASGKTFVGLPARQQVGSDDKIIRNAAGKAQYVSILEWTNKDTAARFTEAVLDAIAAVHGANALKPGGGS